MVRCFCKSRAVLDAHGPSATRHSYEGVVRFLCADRIAYIRRVHSGCDFASVGVKVVLCSITLRFTSEDSGMQVQIRRHKISHECEL